MRLSLLLSSVLLLALAGCDTAPTAPAVPPATAIKPDNDPYLDDLGLQDTHWGNMHVYFALRPSKAGKPTYPRNLKNQDLTGAVMLDILVDENGLPAEVILTKSSGYAEFDNAALKCVKEWRYPVQLANGKPTKVVSRQNIDFMIFVN